jgi:hypothetical protein
VKEYAMGYGKRENENKRSEKAEKESRDESKKRKMPLILNLTQIHSKSES